MSKILTTWEYRAIIALLLFWNKDHIWYTLKQTLEGLGIDASEGDVIDEMWSYGWKWDEDKQMFYYGEDFEEKYEDQM